jgi:hypothetical protein
MPGGVNRRWMPTRRARQHRHPLANVRPTPSDATPGTGRPARARRCGGWSTRQWSATRSNTPNRPRPGRSADQKAAPRSCAVSCQPRWLPRWLRCRTPAEADTRSRCQKPLRRAIESRQERIPDWRVHLDPCPASLAPDGPGTQGAVTGPARQVAGCKNLAADPRDGLGVSRPGASCQFRGTLQVAARWSPADPKDSQR